VRIIARGISNYLLILMFLRLFVLDLWGKQVLSDARRDIAILTFDLLVMAITAIRVFVLHLYTKFEVRRMRVFVLRLHVYQV